MAAAVRLKQADCEVTVVNRHKYHHLTTLLHQPVVGHRNYQDLSIALTDLIPKRFMILRGRVDQIRPADHTVDIIQRGSRKTVAYDQLIVALGWEPEFFHLPGALEHAFVLRDLNSARLIRDRIEESLIAYDEHPEEKWRRSVVVIGGGLTGVEIAGELAEARYEMADAFDLPETDIAIQLVHGDDQLLPGLHESLGAGSLTYLESHGVECILGTHVQAIEPDAVLMEDGRRIEAGVVIWAGGVRGNSILEKSGFAVDKRGRALVNETLLAKDYPDVFVVGDSAAAIGEDGRTLPPTAQLAVQQGDHVGQSILQLLNGKPIEAYHAKDKGIVVSLGRKYALGVVSGHEFKGGLPPNQWANK
jgi:NADH dehydrogenase